VGDMAKMSYHESQDFITILFHAGFISQMTGHYNVQTNVPI